jgi:hypothetical protein
LEFDNWEDFIILLRRWNKPVRNPDTLSMPSLSDMFA